jgi:hypothetical protein
VDEVIVLFKGRVNIKQYIPKHSGILIYKLCDKTDYTYDMEVYLGKDRTRATTDMTTHAIVKHLMKNVEVHGYERYVDNVFSSPDLFDDLTKQKISCCGTV